VVQLETVEEGPSVRTLHVGPFETEAETVARLHAFLRAGGYEPAGEHHEVYLRDLRRTAPERLRTVVGSSYQPDETSPGRCRPVRGHRASSRSVLRR
jgi:hypothetical protein